MKVFIFIIALLTYAIGIYTLTIYTLLRKFKFHVFKWHSINLVPHISFYCVCDSVNYRKIIGRVMQVTIFGYVFDFMWPQSKIKKQISGPVRGPLYSRKRKCWYWVSGDEL